MKKIALIKDGSVYTIAAWDGVSEYNPGEEYQLVDVTDLVVNVGDLYDGTTFTPGPPQETDDEQT